MYWSRFFWITKDRKSLNWLSQRRNLLAHITGKGNDSDKAGPGRSHAKMNNLSLWSYLLPVADSSPLMTVMVKYRSMSTCHHLINSTRKYECLFSKNSSKRLSWALLVHMPAPGSLQLSPRSWNGCCACPSALQAAGKAECNWRVQGPSWWLQSPGLTLGKPAALLLGMSFIRPVEGVHPRD